MFTLGHKNVIINNVKSRKPVFLDVNGDATTTVANITDVHITGYGSFNKESVKSVYLNRARAAVAQVAEIEAGTDLTLGTIDQNVNLTFVIGTKSDRFTAELHNAHMDAGRPYVFQIPVVIGDTVETVLKKIYDTLQFRQSTYNDLPFSIAYTAPVADPAAEGKIVFTAKEGNERLVYSLKSYKTNAADGSGSVSGIVTKLDFNVTTAGYEGMGLGTWVEQNISLHTHYAGSPNATLKDELVDQSALYLSLAWTHGFTSEMIAAASFVGETEQTGSTKHVLFVNEKEKANAELGILIEWLFSITGATGTLPTGADVAGANAAAKKTAFIA